MDVFFLQGVIFHIDINTEIARLCSVSDDRSIRIYKYSGSLASLQNTNFQLHYVLYGHRARVWRAKLLKKYVVSVGEDAVCILWNYDGSLVRKFEGHKGTCIWSLGVNKSESVIVTGGGDSSIRTWSLNKDSTKQLLEVRHLCLPCSQQQICVKCSDSELILNKAKRVMENLTAKKNESEDSFTLAHTPDLSLQLEATKQKVESDFPRTVALLDAQNILVMSNSGTLYVFNTKFSEWEVVLIDETYKSYSVMLTRNKNIVLGNMIGEIIFLKNDRIGGEESVCREAAHKGKVLSLSWTTTDTFLSTGPDGDLALWTISSCEDRLSLLHRFKLPYCSQWWVTSGVIHNNLLICGDRGGTLHVYRMKKNRNFGKYEGLQEQTDLFHPAQSLSRVHGKAGVTDVRLYKGVLYSAGRDGMYRQWKVYDGGRLELMHNNRVCGRSKKRFKIHAGYHSSIQFMPMALLPYGPCNVRWIQ